MTAALWQLGAPPLKAAESLLAQVSAKRLMESVHSLSQWERHSGSQAEADSFVWLADRLRDCGLEVMMHRHEGFISLPGRARLTVLLPEMRQIPCTGLSFSAATAGTETLVSASPVSGQISLVHGLPAGGPVATTETAHGVGVIFYWDDHLHQGQVSGLWGSPTPKSVHLLPQIPAVNIRRSDALWLQEQMAKGPVRVRLEADVETGWRTIPLLVAEQRGEEEPESVVLVSCHVDSWFTGAMDNGAANATALEVARILRGTHPRRTLRYAFWSGHSQGRYAGSTWYADAFGPELARRLVVHINIDSTGGQDSSVLVEAPVMAETFAVADQIVHHVTGQRLRGRRMDRYADQSFLGIGIPSLFATLSEQPFNPMDPPVGVPARTGPVAGGGLGWWWHTTEDLPDKVDPELLVRDTKVYLETAWRFANQPVLPLDFGAVAREWALAFQGYGFAIDQIEIFAREWEETAAAAAGAHGRRGTVDVINRWLMGLARTLIPPGYTEGAPWEHDPFALSTVLPGLARAVAVSRAGDLSGNPELLRQQHRAVRALEDGIRLCREARIHFTLLGGDIQR